jgi:ABC-type glycerol-3-phosphate transport system substrate-binding protein
MLRKNFIVLLAAIIILTFSLAGCSDNEGASNKSPNGDKDGKVEIVLATQGGSVGARLESDVNAFMEAYPNVTVKINEFAETQYMDQGPRLFTSSEKPDVAWFWADDPYLKLANAGVLEPLDDLYESEGWHDVLPKSTIDRVRGNDGKIYAVNESIVWGPVVYYNKEAFEKAGVSVPKTYDEWYEAGAKLKDAGYIPMVSGVPDVGILMLGGVLINSFGPDEYAKLLNDNQKDGDINYNHERVVAAFDELKKMADELMQKGAAGVNDQDARALFTQGKAAMYSSGNWSAGDAILGKELPDNFELGTFYYPQLYSDVPAKVAVYAGNSLLVMKGTGNEEWAKKFVSFVMSKERQIALAESKLMFPSRTDLDKSAIEPMGETYVELYESMVKAGVDNFWHTEVSGELSTAARELITAVMAGSKTGEQAAKELEAILEKQAK